MKDVRKLVSQKKYKDAIALCGKFKDKALPYVVHTGLSRSGSQEKLDFRTVKMQLVKSN